VSPKENCRSFWDLVDAVLVINLDHRQDRWEAFLRNTADVIPRAKLHRVSAVLGRDLAGFGQKPWFRGGKRDGTWGARGGCTLSHRRALQMAKDSGWKTVLILEDDVTLPDHFQTLTARLASILSDPQTDWGICYLAYSDPLPPYRTVARLDPHHTLEQVLGCNSAYAYLASEPVRDFILSRLPTETTIWPWLSQNRAVDRWYQRTLGQRFSVVCTSPGIVNHLPGFSDIIGRDCDYFTGGDHLVSVPNDRGRRAYTLRQLASRASLGADRVYDGFRGYLKRIKGF
jgi:glycosyl transferase, family 25